METEGHVELIGALQRFLEDAAAVSLQASHNVPERVSVQAIAASAAALPTCAEAGAIARRAALAAGYLPSGTARRLSEPAGRPLNADALVSTGVVGMLLDCGGADLRAVACDLAGYLAGPPVGIWDYAILDVGGILPDAVQVVDGWELVTPGADELRRLLPLPSTATWQPARPFDPANYGGLTMLRRVDRDAAPHKGVVLHWDVACSIAIGNPESLLWQPLTALSLCANPVLQLWARYLIEPGRRTDKLFDSVEWEPWTPDGVTELERPMTGSFSLDAGAAPTLRRFLEELGPRLTAALDTQAAGRAERKAKEESANRLQRCAEHFLLAGRHAYDEGEVLAGLEADAILHYVIALESLLGGGERGELARKVSQRAAVLAGGDDAERLEILRVVSGAYGARSEYAHGGKADKIRKVHLAALRWVVRRCILTRLVVGDPGPAGLLYALADRALLSHGELHSQIRRPFGEFADRARLADPMPGGLRS